MKFMVLILSLLLLVIAFILAANSSEKLGYDPVIATNWGFVCMSAIFTIAGVVGIGHLLLKSKEKSDK
jgi:hypothetical protein